MKLITLKFTAAEIEILADLAADQLFRKEFIDSKLPGYVSDAPALNAGKQLVQRMRLAAGAPRGHAQVGICVSTRATGRQNL